MIHKLPYYAKVGVPYLWLVDLDARVMTAQQLSVTTGQPGWTSIGTYSDETEARVPPFDAVPFNIASWWPPAGSIEGEDDEP